MVSLLMLLLLCAHAETRWSAAWSGELALTPGLELGVEHHVTLLDRPRLSLRALGGGSLAGTLRVDSYLRTRLGAAAGVAATVCGVDLDVRYSAGGGYLFRSSPTYALSDDGTALVRVPMAGQWGWMPAATVGIGSALRRDRPQRWFLRGGVMVQTPYNVDRAPFAVLQLGVSSPLGGRR